MEPNHLQNELRFVVSAAHVRLMATQRRFLQPWKNAFLGLERFQTNPDDPMHYAYPAMIDIAFEEGQLDVDDIVEEFESCIIAWVQLQVEQ